MVAQDFSAPLQPILNWFDQQGWTPFPFQREVWQAYLTGESGLIHAPTGTGKTYAAWKGPLMTWLAENPDRSRWDGSKRSMSPPLQVLWITPLRALASDTAESLRVPLDDLGLPWTLETRTGDTSSTVRSRQQRRLPTALVTTPESLSLLLARSNAADLFKHLQAVVVDEWHELMATKRGVQTELALARLRRWHPHLRIWGLSATMGNLDTALQTLLGAADYDTGTVPQGRLVQGDLSKVLRIDSVIPKTIERFPWAGHLGLKLLPEVIDVIDNSGSTLVFTNTRSQTEQWYQAILDARPDWAGIIALHHGSLDREVREWVENGLREGRLRCVVCTSSLDLGVDFSPVERVLQIGSPKGVARLLQRAGRSGHQPGAESRATCVPTHALELIEVAAVREALASGRIEDRNPVHQPLDVLVQHMVTIGLGGGFHEDELFREVRTAHAYRGLPRDEWDWALDFVTRGGSALHAYPQYTRVVQQDGRYVVEDKTVARTHRMSIGTIVSDASLIVKYLKGQKLGYVEESFASRLKPGDKFTLAGRILEFVRIRDMTVYVRRARSKKGVIPRWYGGSLPLSDELTRFMRHKLQQARAGVYDDPEMNAVRPILDLQARWSSIPGMDEVLIERTQTREGHHLFFYPFEGRLVHQGLAALFAYRIAQIEPITFTIATNDYGFELLSPDRPPLEAAIENGLVSADNLLEDILASLNASELARRQFREIARVAGLVVTRFPGGQKSAKQLQASSGLLYDVLENYDPENLLLNQARREVLERQLERTRLRSALHKFDAYEVLVNDTPRPTPFAFPLLVDRLRQTVSSETLEDRVNKLVKNLEKAAHW